MKSTRSQSKGLKANRRMKNRPCRSAARVLTAGILTVLPFHSVLHAATVTWSGTGVDVNWGSAGNWSSTLANNFSADLVFAGSALLSNSNNLTNGTATSITFNAGAGAFVLNGNAITLSGGITNNSTSLQTISFGITTTAQRTITLTAGGGDVTIRGNITGSGGALSLAGAGTLTLSGSNSYTGNTTISGAETLAINSNYALGLGTLICNASSNKLDNTSGSDVTIANNLNLNTSPLFVGSGNLSITGTTKLITSSRTLTVVSSTLTLATIDADSTLRALTQAGNGTLAITGAATANFAGGFLMGPGQTIIGNKAALGSGTLTLQTGTLAASTDLSGANSVANNVTFGGSATIGGTNNLTLSGTFTQNNNSRTLTVNNTGSTTISGPLNLSESNTGRTLTINGSGNTNISGAIGNGGTGASALIYQGTGILTLSASNSYTGATTVSSGTVALGNGGHLGATAVTVNAGATLAIAQNANGSSNTIANGSNAFSLAAGSALSMGDGYTSTLNLTGAATATLAPASGVSPTLTFDIVGSSADKLAITGPASVGAAAAKIAIVPGSGAAPGSYTLITAASGLGSNFSLALTTGSLYVGSGGVYGASLAGTGTTEIVTLTHNGLYWTGVSGSTWSTAGNWNTTVSGGVVSGTAPGVTTDVAFGTTSPGNLTNTLGADMTVNSVNFLPGSASVTVTPGNTLTIGGGGITNASANAQTINAPIVLGTSQAWANTGAGSLTISGTVTTGGYTLTVPSGNTTLSGPIIGSLAKSGSGTLTLSGLSASAAANYAGATTLDGGTLAITTSNPSLSGSLVFGATAGSANVSTLDLSNASATFGGLTVQTNSTGANLIAIGSGKTFTVNGNVAIGVNANVTTKLNVTGTGATWNVTNLGGTFQLGVANTTVTDVVAVDLSGLGTFNANLGPTGVFRVGSNTANQGTGCTLTLAGSSNTIIAGILGVGDKSGISTGTPNALYLGANATNNLAANTINVGYNVGNRGLAALQFSGTGTGSVKIRAADGASAAALNMIVGTISTSSTPTSTFDITGHSADLLFSTVDTMDVSQPGGSYSSTFSFDNGTLTSGTFKIGTRTGGASTNAQSATVNIGGTGNYSALSNLGTVTMAQMSATAGGMNGALNIAGNNTTVNITSLNLASNTAVGGAATGALNITGGTVNLTGGGITIGSTTGTVNSAVALSNAVLNMQGHDIGSASAAIGSFTFTSGTLQDAGAVYAPVTLTGSNAHVLNQTASAGTIGGIISGTGQTLTKTGSNTLTLTGVNTYTGATNVNAGRLVVSGSGAFSASTTLSVASGAFYYYQPAALGAQTIAGLTLGNGSTLGLSWTSAPANSSLSVTGAVTPTGGTVAYLAMTGTPLMGNAYTVLSGSAGSTLNNASYLLLNPTAYTYSVTSTGTSVAVTPSAATPLAVAYWTGNSTSGINGVWAASDGSTTSNWAATSGGAVQALIPSGVAITFPASPVVGATNTRLGVDMSVGSVAISDTVNGLGINADGSTLTIAGSNGITMDAGVPASTIGANVALGAAQTWTNNSASLLTISGAVSNGGNALTVAGSGSTTLSGVVAGTGALNQNGPGTLTLTANNSYTGATTIAGGTLTVAGAGQLNGGSYAGAISNAGALVYASSAAQTLSGTISGAGSLTQNGPGALTLTGSNTYSGPTTITGGTLTIGGAGRLGGGSYAGNIANSGAFVCSSSAAQILSGAISGAGSLTQSGPGMLTLSGSNSFTGNTVLAGGTTLLNSANALGSTGTISFTGGALRYSASNTADYSGKIAASTGAIAIDPNGQSITFASPLVASNTVGLSLLGSGTLMLSATNTFGGPVTVSAGVLQAAKLVSLPTYAVAGSNIVGAAGALAVNAGGAGEFTVGNIQTLLGNMTVSAGGQFGIDTTNAGGTFAYASPLTGNVGLLKLGSGTLILSASSTNTGNMTISGGAVQLSGSGSAASNPLGLGTVTVNSGATLDLAGYTLGAANSLALSGSLTNSGGAAVYSGAVTTGQFATIGGGGDITLTAALSGSGTFNKAGSGTLTLSASSNRTAGGAVLQSGVLQLNNTYAIGSNLSVTFAGGALAIGGSAAPVLSTATLSASGTASLGAGASLSFSALADNGNTLTVTGSGNLAQTGAWGNSTGGVTLGPSFTGTAAFNQANLFSGPLTIKSGFLSGAGNAAAFGSGTLVIGNTADAANATVQGDGHTFANPIAVQAGSSGTLMLQTAAGAATAFSGPVTLNNTLNLATTGNGTLTLTGAVGGPGSLVTNGAVTLTTVSTFTGGLTVSSGTLKTVGATVSCPSQLTVAGGAVFDVNGSVQTFGGLAGSGTITNNLGTFRALTLNGSGSYTYSGAMTSANLGLTVAMASSGVQTLTGSSSFTGATTVNGGKLALGPGGSLGNTAVTVGAGGTFGAVQNTNGASNTLGSSLVLNAGGAFTMADGYASTLNVSGSATLAPATGASPTLTFDIASASADLLAITGSATVGAAGAKIVIAPSPSAVTVGSYTLMTAASGLGSNISLSLAAPSFYVGSGGVYGASLAGTGTTEIVTLTHNGLYWTGSSGSAWNTAGNWNTTVAGGAVSGAAPGGATDVAFGTTSPGNLTNTLGVSTTVNSVNFLPASASVTVNGGNTLTIEAGGITNTSVNPQTINAPIVMGTSQTWTNTGSGLLTVGGTVATAGNTLTVSGTGGTVLSGPITGSGGLTRSGTGMATVSGLSATAAVNYSGATTLDGGTLAITTTNPSLSGWLVFGGAAGSGNVGTLDLSNASATFGGLAVQTNSTGTNAIAIGSGKALTINGNVAIGINPSVANTTTKLNVSGAGGAWNVTNPGGTFLVGMSTNVTYGDANTVDLSGLGTFNANLGSTGYFDVGIRGVAIAGPCTLALASGTNTIVTGTLGVGDRSGTGVGTNTLNLGANAINTLYANTIAVSPGSGARGYGALQFSGAGTGSVKIRGADGSSVAALNMLSSGLSTGYLITALFDVTGHSADMLFSTVDMMNVFQPGGSYSSTFSFDNGTLTSGTFKIGTRTGGASANAQSATVNIGGTGNSSATANLGTVMMAEMSGTTGGITGALNVAGNNTTVNITSLTLGGATAAGGTASGALNITGGTVNLTGGGITLGGTAGTVNSAITLSNAVLNMQGHDIGSATASIGSFAFTSGTVQDVRAVYGPITLAGSNTHVFNTATTSGTINGALSGNGVLAKSGTGTLTLSGSVGIGGLDANSGTVQLVQSGTIGAIGIGTAAKLELTANNVNSAKVLDTSSLSISTGGTLDLWDNALILRDPTSGTNQGTNLSMVQSLVNAAADNGNWDKPGITSSSVIADLGAYSVLTVMVYDNTVLGVDSFEGVNGLSTENGGNQVMLKTTYLGDFDGNGIVNSADYGWLDFYYGYGLTVGDLNGDGQVNSADYNGIDYGYGYQAYGVLAGGGTPGASAAPAVAPAPSEAVPEPGSLGLLFLGASALLGARRKKKGSNCA